MSQRCGSCAQTLKAALAWINSYGDPDGDGFIEYYRATERVPTKLERIP